MAKYHAHVAWSLKPGEDFARGAYSRAHTLGFDEGLTVPGSASPNVVGNKWSRADAVDPEEALVSALSACHMLTFLHVARLAGHVVTAYEDAAEGVMEPNAAGKLAVTRVILRPVIEFEGEGPAPEALAALHHDAHEECYIASSVLTQVTVEAR